MSDEPVADLPPLVPARMVNEFVFCPRFFYLAWSSGESGENEFTVDGKWVHRRVDVESGRLGGPGEDSSVRTTSVTLSSEVRGAIAKIDIVESSDGFTRPIELKRGRPRDPDHPVWDPERIQLALQGLILRDNGYRCDRGEVRFAGARERIEIPIDEVLEARVESVLASLRACAAAHIPPAPLVDSPKCLTCIMVGACLPDEHNLIRKRSANPARRLVPSEDARRPLYLTEAGTRIGVAGETLDVRKGRR